MTLTRTQAWERICRWEDGLAIGSTVVALADGGVLSRLEANGSCSMGELREGGGNAGFLQVALRLLALQGWVEREGEPGTDDARFTLNVRGRAMVRAVESYRRAVGVLTERAYARARGEMRREWALPADLTPVSVRHQIAHHLDGHAVAPVLARMTAGETEVPEAAAGILEDAGVAGDATVLSMARQLWYPMAYLPMFARAGELLFGDAARVTAAGADGGETHIDRRLDIRFSGDVFETRCRGPLLEMALPLFEGADGERPAAVVDTGSGNGALLRLLAEALGGRARGIVFAGVDPSAAAREATGEALSQQGVAYRVLDGDVTEPAALAGTLEANGVDPERALHVSKSVIHNRRYMAPRALHALPVRSAGAYATRDGAMIANTALTSNLVEHFAAWRPLVRRYGMLVIEAHTAAPETAFENCGRTIATVLDATHGYSSQYPVEPEVFAAAAQAAGLRSVAHRELGTATTGHTVLTIDRFVVSDGAERLT